MRITNFKKTGSAKFKELNGYLKENHGVKITGFHSRNKLENVREQAEAHVVRLRNTNKKFNLDPEYAKYLGVKDVIDVMLEEGMYVESPAMQEMKQMINDGIQQLMDSGYTVDEASAECMNRFRQDSRFAHDDEFVLPIVLKAAKDYMEACGMKSEDAPQFPSTDIGEFLFKEMAREVGMELDSVDTLKAIEEKLGMFAEVSGKSRDAVVGFLNGLEEDAVGNGIQMFGKKVSEQNKFTGARKDAIAQGKDEFEVDGETYKITGDTKDEKKQAKESMFDDIIDDMISESTVEEAEVVMAARALSDDIQDQIERLGRMQNEDIPAIADQMRAEFGAEAAQSFGNAMNAALEAHLGNSKSTKAEMDNAIGTITGEAPASAPAGDMGLGNPEAPMDMPADDMPMDEPVDNLPAAAGPEEEPLGRAPVEV
jgi:plasmid stabilization system protein ParE